jgi:hypothetical protein
MTIRADCHRAAFVSGTPSAPPLRERTVVEWHGELAVESWRDREWNILLWTLKLVQRFKFAVKMTMYNLLITIGWVMTILCRAYTGQSVHGFL